MKLFPLFLLLCLCFQIYGQENGTDIKTKIKFFNSKIQQTEKGERLQWLDSLTSLVRNKTELKYDSIARECINFAISIDSLDSAAGNVASLMDYNNNYLGRPKEGLKLFNNYYDKLKEGIDFKRLGYLYLNAADGYYFSENVDKSFEYYELTKVYALKAKDQHLYATALYYMALNQSDLGQFVNASQGLEEASKIYTKLKDTIYNINIKNVLASLFVQNAFYKKGKIERDEALILAYKINSTYLLRNIHFNLASDSSIKDLFSTTVGGTRSKNEIVDEIANLKKSLLADRKTDYISIEPYILSELVKVYVQSDSLDLAANKFKEIQQLWLKDKSDKLKGVYLEAKSWMFLGKGDFKNAIKYGRELLELQKKQSIVLSLMTAEKFLSDVYRLNDDIPNYNQHLLNFYTIKDSISSVQKVKALSYYQTLYETEKQRLKIETQENDIALLASESKIKNQFILFGIVSLSSLFLLVIVYKSRNTEKKKKKLQEQFTQGLLQSQEKERTRIARELHDSVGQQLTLIKRKSQNLEQVEITALTNNALEEVRSISRGLYPQLLKELGLTESVKQLINEYDEQTDLFFSMDIDFIDPYFTENTTLNFYRLIQECLTNIVRHAKAKTVIVSVKKEGDSIISLISDNGKGFNVTESKNKNNERKAFY
tara:strand:+ start:2496 stop:4466 length:1971 start_codon:yes stop_codon:yes gene_type:complete